MLTEFIPRTIVGETDIRMFSLKRKTELELQQHSRVKYVLHIWLIKSGPLAWL
jgi:hypothetical protein